MVQIQQYEVRLYTIDIEELVYCNGIYTVV